MLIGRVSEENLFICKVRFAEKKFKKKNLGIKFFGKKSYGKIFGKKFCQKTFAAGFPKSAEKNPRKGPSRDPSITQVLEH